MSLEPALKAREAYFDAPVKRVVDVGSRDGHDAVRLGHALAAPEVVCVEPREEAARAIRQTYPDVRVYEVAVSDSPGVALMVTFDSGDVGLQGSASLNVHRGALHPDEARYRDVKVERLDAFLPRGQIDVLKVDVEGYTLQALRGLGTMLSDVLVAHLETETLERAAWAEPATNHAVAYFMRANGFRLFHLDYEWGPSIEDQTWVNVVHPKAKPSHLTEREGEPELAR